MPDVTVNGIRIAYDEHGDGDPLVLVCGLGQPALTWPISILPGLVAAGFGGLHQAAGRVRLGFAGEDGDFHERRTGSVERGA